MVTAFTLATEKEELHKWFSPATWDHLGEKILEWSIQALPAVCIILLLAVFALRVTRGLIGRLKPRMLKHMLEARQVEPSEVEKQIETLFGIVYGTLRVVVWAVAVMLVLRNIGIDIAPILAGAGVVGLAVGFGAQELVRDVISGFFMLLENHIRNGDVVQVNGIGGQVEKVGLRTIVLRDASGTVHVFQNGKVTTLANMTKEWSAMVFDIAVAYDTNLELAIRTMGQVAEELRSDAQFGPRILEPMEIYGVDAFGKSEIIVKARIKTKPSEQWSIGREYRKRLKHAFDVVGIEMPFPQQTLWFRESGKALPPKG